MRVTVKLYFEQFTNRPESSLPYRINMMDTFMFSASHHVTTMKKMTIGTM